MPPSRYRCLAAESDSMASMIRDLDRLTAQTFDVLVVGGGIYGLTIAYDAAQRGLSVALIERNDFGSGASFNHLRTIHGGLRYLQSLDLGRARESIRERRTIARIAPHAVRPLPFAVPLYRSLTRGKMAMRAGFLLDRIVAADRNRGVPASHRLPGGRVVFAQYTRRKRFPGLRRQGLTGAAVFYDYVTTEPDRLTFSFAHGRRRARRGARQPRRGDGSAGRRPARHRRQRARHDRLANRRYRREDDHQRHRRPRRRIAQAVGHHDRHPDAEGDEPRHEARRRRRGARRPLQVGPQSVSGAVARTRAVRHVGVGRNRATRTTRPSPNKRSPRSSPS